MQSFGFDNPLAVYTGSVGELIRLARREAVAHQQEYIGTQHLLLAFTRLDDHPIGRVLLTSGISADKLRDVLATHLEPSPVAILTDQLPLSPSLKRAVEQTELAARSSGIHGAKPEHLFITLLNDSESLAADALRSLGVDTERLRSALIGRLQMS